MRDSCHNLREFIPDDDLRLHEVYVVEYNSQFRLQARVIGHRAKMISAMGQRLRIMFAVVFCPITLKVNILA